MKGNRGSAALISIIFMMFLLIIGIGFIPLMSSEVKHASMDMDEQKAWYAAEAGIKYAKAYQNDASLVLKDKLGISQKLSYDSDSASYTLKVFDKTLGVAVDGSYPEIFPVADRTYTVYSEGLFNGVKKIISDEFVFSTSSSSGGGSSGGGTSGGGSGGKPSELLGVINAGVIDLTQSGGTSNMAGALYATDIIGGTTNDGGKYNYNKQDASYVNALFTQIPSSWFPTIEQVISANYDKLKSIYGAEPKKKIKSNNSYYIDGTSVVDNKGKVNGNAIQKITGESGSIVYVYDSMGDRIQQIVGPASGVPFTVVLVNSTEPAMNVQTYGNVRILASNNLKFSGGSQQSGKLMVMTNANMELQGWTVKLGFVSANGDILISGGSFTGQIMAKGKVTIKWQKTTYDNTVLSDENFWLSEWS